MKGKTAPIWMWGALGLVIGFGILVALGWVSLASAGIVLVAILVLHLLTPLRYNGNFATFELMMWAGYILGLFLEPRLAEMPPWSFWAWLALSLTVSALFPVPKLNSSFH